MCVVTVTDCRAMKPDDAPFACIGFRPGMYVWVLEHARVVEPVPITGQQRLFDVRDGLIHQGDLIAAPLSASPL